MHAGAVLYGCSPLLIRARRSKLTYGVAISIMCPESSPGAFWHDEEKCYYTSVFLPFVSKNELVGCSLCSKLHVLATLYATPAPVPAPLVHAAAALCRVAAAATFCWGAPATFSGLLLLPGVQVACMQKVKHVVSPLYRSKTEVSVRMYASDRMAQDIK